MSSIENVPKETLCPDWENIFRVFEMPLDEIKVIIVAQDPYYQVKKDSRGKPVKVAHGLAFSSPCGIQGSLQGILEEIVQEVNRGELPDRGICTAIKKREVLNDGDLSNWVEQGVFLYNVSLSTECGSSRNHTAMWSEFSTNVLKYIADNADNLVVMLWGRDAQRTRRCFKKDKNDTRHLVLESAHPSPRSVHLFMGNGHFAECNKYLVEHNKIPIKWK
jgi:uracil-DNA glycosylase